MKLPCTLCEEFAAGNPQAPLSYIGENYQGVLLVGESPHKNWVESGSPFSSASGKLNPTSKRLSEYLSILGYSLSDIALVESAKCVVPNRKHLPSMMSNCRSHLSSQIKELKPRLIITVGKLVAENFGTMVGAEISPLSLGNVGGIKILSLFHPSPINPNNHQNNLIYLSAIKNKKEL